MTTLVDLSEAQPTQGRRKRGGWGGGALAPQFLAKQLTLSQPGGQIIPTTILPAPGFSDLATGLQGPHLVIFSN